MKLSVATVLLLQSAGQIAQPPRPPEQDLNFSFRDYPSAALAKHEYGIVTVLLRTDEEGRVRDCLVTETSGSPDLDRGTCALAKRRGRFRPAVNATGQPTAGEYSIAISWGVDDHQPTTRIDLQIPVREVPDQYTRPAMARVEFGADGRAATCDVTTSSGSVAADAAVCRIVVSQLTITKPKSGSAEPARAIRYAYVSLIGSIGKSDRQSRSPRSG